MCFALDASRVLSQLTEPQKFSIVSAMSVTPMPEGTVLEAVGSPLGNGMYIVVKGSLYLGKSRAAEKNTCFGDRIIVHQD
jgi:hypothetical protein